MSTYRVIGASCLSFLSCIERAVEGELGASSQAERHTNTYLCPASMPGGWALIQDTRPCRPIVSSKLRLCICGVLLQFSTVSIQRGCEPKDTSLPSMLAKAAKRCPAVDEQTLCEYIALCKGGKIGVGRKQARDNSHLGWKGITDPGSA